MHMYHHFIESAAAVSKIFPLTEAYSIHLYIIETSLNQLVLCLL